MLKSYLEVNLKNIEENILKIKNYVGENVTVAPVIKADAYGLGATKLKNILERQNIKIVVVATLQEAIKLRNNGFNMEILLLNELLPFEASKIVKYNLTVGISTLEIAEKLDKIAIKNSKIIKVHLKVDTGMGRVGIKPENALDFMNKVNNFKNIEVEGIYTHFSSADTNIEYTNKQIDLFKNAIENLRENGYKFKYIHSSASSGIINFKDSNFNMVRPGIILYGYMPDKNMENTLNIKPATKLVSHIVFIKEVPKETAISYGRTYITKSKATIATIPLGYADGIKRLLSNKGKVYINGKYAPIVGNVCMDNFMIDITKIDAKVGDEVIIWDNNNITIEEIADICNTINYEILTSVSKRVKRKYITK